MNIHQENYSTTEVEKWNNFRNSLSSLFPNRTGAVMNLFDSLSSNFSAKTVVHQKMIYLTIIIIPYLK
jgi:hypothetical protein